MAMVYEPMVECGIVLCLEKYGNVGRFLQDFHVPLAWKIELIRHINLGMNYLHTNQPPVIHGDLKAPNILIGEGFIAKVKYMSVNSFCRSMLRKGDICNSNSIDAPVPHRRQLYDYTRNDSNELQYFLQQLNKC